VITMQEIVEYQVEQDLIISQPVQETPNEYISLCDGCIVYRNVNSNKIFKWIREVQVRYSRSCALLLVRQIDNNVQLLWTGTVPQEFWFNRRRPTKIKIDKEEYLVLSSMSIGEEP
jgi:hypothetical protein